MNVPVETSGFARRASSFSCLKSAWSVEVFFCCSWIFLMTVSRVTLAALAGTVAAATDTHSAAIKSFLLDMRCPTVRAGRLFLAERCGAGLRPASGAGNEGRPGGLHQT